MSFARLIGTSTVLALKLQIRHFRLRLIVLNPNAVCCLESTADIFVLQFGQ